MRNIPYFFEYLAEQAMPCDTLWPENNFLLLLTSALNLASGSCLGQFAIHVSFLLNRRTSFTPKLEEPLEAHIFPPP